MVLIAGLGKLRPTGRRRRDVSGQGHARLLFAGSGLTVQAGLDGTRMTEQIGKVNPDSFTRSISVDVVIDAGSVHHHIRKVREVPVTGFDQECAT
jgi:hypothetical protein